MYRGVNMILMIDNYDSFVYNLVQYFQSLYEEVLVYRNDAITIEEIRQMNPSMIVLSPGPCTPKESGVCLDIINNLKDEFKILGICLGFQAIAQVFGGRIIRALEPVHGKVFPINHNGKGLFYGLNQPLNVTRYHSLIVERDSLPSCFEITAETDDGVIMGIRHKSYPIVGVQFHPEAILTEQGHELLNNFIKRL